MKHTRESIIALINECRKTGKCVDLSEQDLSGLDLQEANLRGANLRGANLQWANLQWANLQEANLQEADLDYCGIELSCRIIGIKANKRLVSQLLYHLCRMDVSDCPEWAELRNDERVIALANQSHVIPVHDLPEIEPLSVQELECPECKREIYSSKWIICPHCGCDLGSDKNKICINIGEVEHVLRKHGIHNQVMPFVKVLLDGAKNAKK